METRFISSRNTHVILAGVLALFGLYLTSLYSYLLFHSLAEIFSIVVAFAIFILAWNARRFLDNNYLLLIGIAYFFVAILDLVHTLAYKGMGIFQAYDADLPTQLWIAGRYLESISLLIAPFFLSRRLNIRFTFFAYALVVSLLLTSIFWGPVFPHCYTEGTGLTPFKKISEYIISLILLASIVLLLQHRQDFDTGVLRLLGLSIIVTIGAELAFTFYIGVYDLSNLIGHYFKIISFYLIYKAIVETGLAKPYNILFRHLSVSKEKLQQSTIELQAHIEELDAFSHTVAHDLKSPLARIVTAAEMLDIYYDSLSEQERRQGLAIVSGTASKMNDIIDGLLLLAQIRREDVSSAPLKMADIVAEVQQRLAHLIKEHECEIILPDTWPVALGYSQWIEEVWANYLSNAIKYGGRPPRVELGATPQANGAIRFWVRDNGPGLTPKDQARLFTPFSKIGRSHAEGHGLGLSIARRIIEKLGGQVGVESNGIPGQGSLFFFTLPGASNHALENPPLPKPSPG